MGERDDLTEEEKARLVAAKILKQKDKNRLHYRINGVRQLTGGRRVEPELPEHLAKILDRSELIAKGDLDAVSEDDAVAKEKAMRDLSENGRKAVIEFAASSYAVLENEQLCKVMITRYGNLDNEVSFRYGDEDCFIYKFIKFDLHFCEYLLRVETIDGTAEAGSDYHKIDEVKTMVRNQRYMTLDVIIVDDNQWEPDETFFVKLSAHGDHENVKIGPKGICMITIINDDGKNLFFSFFFL